MPETVNPKIAQTNFFTVSRNPFGKRTGSYWKAVPSGKQPVGIMPLIS